MIEKGKNTRAEILRSYNDLMYERGPKNVTIRDIAERAGITIGNLYYYFKKKGDIAFALSVDLYGKLNIILNQCLKTKISHVERILVEFYVIILLYMKIKPLQTFAVETANDLSLLTEVSQAFALNLRSALEKDCIEVNKHDVFIAAKVGLMSFYLSYKEDYEHELAYTAEKFFNVFFNVLFSIIDIPTDYSSSKLISIINDLDENYLIKQIYTLQDYNYEFVED